MLATVFWPNSSHGTDCILQQGIGTEWVCKNRQAGTETTQAMLTFVLWPGTSPFSVNPSSPHSEKVQMATAPELQTITATNLGMSSTAELSDIILSGLLGKLGQQ